MRTYVHRLRAAFGPDLAGRIETVAPGYRLNLERGEFDADRFDELASSAARMASVGNTDGSRDDRFLLTDHDSIARLWDVETGQQVGIDMPTSGDTNSGANHGDTLQLVTGGDDVAYVWNLDADSWAEIACQVAGSNLSADEWAQWGPRDEDHRAICEDFPLQ